MLSLDGDDPVAIQLRASRRRLASVAVFSGVVNLLTLSAAVAAVMTRASVVRPRVANLRSAVSHEPGR